ncbi:MAG: SMP-30/gluconolactonase/LRE family protein, partial [Opitutae bacterium]|nr:SMP-30/gluconolactonase/LRE family protein [Opitutae bacterium]
MTYPLTMFSCLFSRLVPSPCSLVGHGFASRLMAARGVALLAVVLLVGASAGLAAVGDYRFTTFAGGNSDALGTTNGQGVQARFGPNLHSLVEDASGNLYVADPVNNQIRKISPDGYVTTLAGSGAQGYADGTGLAASFNYPYGLALASDGSLYVTELYNHRVRKVTPAGVVTTIAGDGGDGFVDNVAGTAARFSEPSGIAVAANGDIYVSEQKGNRIRKIEQGTLMVTLVAGSPTATPGYAEGAGIDARFSSPVGIHFASNGDLLVADYQNKRIRKIVNPGTVPTVSTYISHPGAVGILDFAVGAGDVIYAPSYTDHTIQRFNTNGSYFAIAGTSGQQGTADGDLPTARFNYPRGIVVNSRGTLYVSDYSARIREVTFSGDWTSTFAGATDRYGNTNGARSWAKLPTIRNAAVDASGAIYFAADGGHSIRKIANGMVTTYAGSPISGYADANGLRFARFNNIQGLAFDSAGNLYVSEVGNRRIRRITPAGLVTTIAGDGGNGYVDSSDGLSARFGSPGRLCYDATANALYVIDSANVRIRKISLAAGSNYAVSTYAGDGNQGNYGDGQLATVARFWTPTDVVTDASGSLYISEAGMHRIRKIEAGTLLVSTFAGDNSGNSGNTDGEGINARFNGPWGLAIDAAGNLYVADTQNNKIRKVTPSGSVTSLAGSAGTGLVDGSGTNASFWAPYDVATDPTSGDLIVADLYNYAVRRVTPAGVVSTEAGWLRGNGVAGSGEVDGLAKPTPSFSGPNGMDWDASGNLYVADRGSHMIWKITPSGAVTLLAGNFGWAGFNEGTGQGGWFNTPLDVAVDAAGNVYVADQNNHRIRKVTPSGGTTTFAGDGTSGYLDSTAPTTARFSSPAGLAFSPSKDVLYVADFSNHVIRQITMSTGAVSTVAGTAGTPGLVNGPVGSARFDNPVDLVSDGSGALYVVDSSNHVIRKISGGTVTTYAGTGVSGYADNADPALAQFSAPQGLARDSAGNLYVTVANGARIRKISPSTGVTTLGGSGGTGYREGEGTVAQFDGPRGIVVDAGGRLYIADLSNGVIRLGTPPYPVITSATTATGPYGSSFSFTVTAVNDPTSFALTGTLPAGLTFNPTTGVISGTPTAAGASTVNITATNAYGTGSAVPLTITISPITLTVTGLTATKQYDGGTTATLTGTPALSGVLPGDAANVTLSGTAAGSYANAAVGTGKTVTLSGLSLGGSAAANYTLTGATLTGGITQRVVTISGITATSKTYDGTTSVTITGTGTVANVVGSESVSVSGTASGAFANKNAGTGKSILVSGLSIAGADVANYTLSGATLTATADITAKALTVSGLTASNKVYDGTTTATLSGTAALSGLVVGDLVTLGGTAVGTFANKQVEAGKAVTITGNTITGDDAPNYTFTQQAGLTASITAKALTVSGLTASNKVYDGTTTATLSGTAALNGLVVGDLVTLGGTAVGTFANKQVEAGKAVTVTGNTITGDDAPNYTFTQQAGLTASITAKALTAPGVVALSKTYDGTTTATLNVATPSFSPALYAGDTVTVKTSGYTAQFDTANVGTAKAVTVTNLGLDGAEAGNYALTQPTGLTADITGASQGARYFTGYYPTWSANLFSAFNDPGTYASPKTDAEIFSQSNLAGLPADYTHVVISFAQPDFTWNGLAANNWTGTGLNFGAQSTPKDIKEAVRVMKALGKKVLLAVGGATYNNWDTLANEAGTTMASAPTKTALKNFVVDLGLDGLDVDYEIASATTADTANETRYKKAIQAMREAVDAATTATGTPHLLAIAAWSTGADFTADTTTDPDYAGQTSYFGGSAGRERRVFRATVTASADQPALVGRPTMSLLDVVNIMSYDAGYQHFDPVRAYSDYRKLLPATTPVSIGVEIPDEAAGAPNKAVLAITNASAGAAGTLVTADQYGTANPGAYSVERFAATVQANTVNANPHDGLMLWQVFKDAAGSANPAATPTAVQNQVHSQYSAESKTAQTITFAALGDVTYGAASFSVSASASSGLGVAYTITGPATLSGTTVTITGAGTVTVTAMQGGNASYLPAAAVARSFTVNKKALTLSGVTAVNRTYDGTTSVTLNTTSAVLATIEGSDAVTLDASAYSAQTDSKNTGPSRLVTVTGLTLSGAKKDNYTLTQPTGLTAAITAKALTVSGLTAGAKVYDGTTTATLGGTAVLQASETAGSGTTSDGKPYTGDTVTLDGTAAGAFADKDVGPTKPVTVTGLSTANTNYTITQQTGLTAA